MSTSSPAGAPRPPGPSLTALMLVNAPAAVALAVAAGLLWGDSAAWRWPAAGALLAAVAVGAAATLGLRREAGRQADAFAAALHESTDRRRQLRSILDTAADGILTFDEMGRITLANAAAGRMFGYEPDELLGQPIEAVLPDARAGRDGRPIVGTNEGKVFGFSTTVEGLHRKDGAFPVSVGISKVRLKGRAVYTTIVRDLTVLREAQHAAEAASRAKTRFLVHMSHELRTPLGGVLGMAEVLGGTPLSEEQRRYLKSLEGSALTLLALVEQAVDYSRLEAGETALARRAFSVRQLVGEVMSPLAERARTKGLRLAAQVQTELPDGYVGDPDRLRQALHALADNAVKFTARGEVTLRAREARPGKGEPAGVVFEVRDTGGGVPPREQERIFQPFEQGDNSSTKLHGGMGLGLSLAARLVGLMGGQIICESDEGKGSTFRVAVPLEASAAPAERPPPSVLLVLGDERRGPWRELVRSWGWPAVAVATGKAAMTELLGAVVRGAPFGVVVVEARLPDMVGGDVVRWLAARDECRCPAVVVGDGTAAGGEAVDLRGVIQEALAGMAR